MKSLDLICVGRCVVDLYCDQIGVPLSQGRSLSMYVGGCAANVAIGARRLRARTALLTHVGDDAMGEFVLENLRREDVDITHVIRDPEARTPLSIASIEPPDRFEVSYYRERAADMRVRLDDAPAEWLASSKAVVLTGNSLSVPEQVPVMVEIARRARAGGTRVIFDIDYRPTLWPQGTEELGALLPLADLVVGTEDEYRALTNLEDARQAFDTLRARTGALYVMKLGPRGAIAAVGDGGVAGAPAFPSTVLNTLGAGDAFLASFSVAWLKRAGLESALRDGNGAGAMVVSRHGCSSAMPTLNEFRAFMRMMR